MKKLVLILLMLLPAAFATAQFHYGLRLGGEFTRPTASGGASVYGGNGFAGGLTANYVLPKAPLAFTASVLYERRNITATDANNSTCSFGHNVIAVPADLGYRLPLHLVRDLVSPYVFTGPDLAWRLGDCYGRDFHFGWNVGVRIDVIDLLQLSGGYRFGINNIAPGPNKLRDSGGFFSVAILFSI